MYKIGEFSKLAKTTIKTLRYDEKEEYNYKTIICNDNSSVFLVRFYGNIYFFFILSQFSQEYQ